MLSLMLMAEQSEGETLDGKQLREEEWIKRDTDVDPDTDAAGARWRNRRVKPRAEKS